MWPSTYWTEKHSKNSLTREPYYVFSWAGELFVPRMISWLLKIEQLQKGKEGKAWLWGYLAIYFSGHQETGLFLTSATNWCASGPCMSWTCRGRLKCLKQLSPGQAAALRALGRLWATFCGCCCLCLSPFPSSCFIRNPLCFCLLLLMPFFGCPRFPIYCKEKLDLGLLMGL